VPRRRLCRVDLDWVLRASVVPLLVLGLALRLFIAITKPQVLWIDDSFYSLGIARNIALGLGWTHDGIHTTNGFQPLYVFLMVPFYWLLPKYGTLVPGLALVIQSFVSAGTGLILFRLVYEQIGLRGAFLTLLAWSFSPYIITGINGLETSIQAFLFISICYLYVKHWRNALTETEFSTGKRAGCAVLLGLSGGLFMLARIDSAIFVLILLLDLTVRIIFFNKKGERGRSRLYYVSIAAICAFGIIIFLWFIPSIIVTGRFYFDSGNATRLRSIAEAQHTNIVLSNIRALVPNFQDRVATVILPWSSGVQRRYLLLSGILMVLTAAFALVKAKTATKLLKIMGNLAFIWGYALALLAAYVGYQFTVWGWPRYFYPLALVELIILGMWAEIVFGSLGPRPAKIRTKWLVSGSYIGICFAYLLLLPVSIDRNFNPILAQPRNWYTAGQYVAADWLARYTAPDTRVAAFQSGILGYFSNRTVVNLDGVVNNAVLPYYISGNIAEYLVQEHATHIADWTHFTRTVDFSKAGEVEPSILATIRVGNPVEIISLSLRSPE
jgi:hypothetical protein